MLIIFNFISNWKKKKRICYRNHTQSDQEHSCNGGYLSYAVDTVVSIMSLSEEKIHTIFPGIGPRVGFYFFPLLFLFIFCIPQVLVGKPLFEPNHVHCYKMLRGNSGRGMTKHICIVCTTDIFHSGRKACEAYSIVKTHKYKGLFGIS